MNTEDKLRSEIKQQLEKVTEANSPEIYKRLQTMDGYASLEDSIIRQMIATGTTPAAVIPQMETEYTML